MESNKLEDLLDNSNNQPTTSVPAPKMESNQTTNAETDPATIEVEIRSNAPIVIFYGPMSIGKTIALMRLSRYLKANYRIEAERNFRKNDQAYKTLCDNFSTDYLENTLAPNATAVINFLLLTVIKDGVGDVCQLLEAPGEHYFDVNNPTADYWPYFSRIINSAIPKVYVIFFEIDWQTKKDADNYAAKIVTLITRVKEDDYIILLTTKADQKTEFLYKGPEVNKFKKVIKSQYKAVFDMLEPKDVVGKLFGIKPFPYSFKVFSAGDFKSRAATGQTTFTEGDDFYPAELWKAITKGIKGGW